MCRIGSQLKILLCMINIVQIYCLFPPTVDFWQRKSMSENSAFLTILMLIYGDGDRSRVKLPRIMKKDYYNV